jgi:UDP-N-acetylglucosamine--N-acetylmuramyl-(pentapeptide) pyrophosphoryl-undecaprenol N-acetylglucosamine transferase
MNTTTHIVFSGGVTGGHLFPGLAVAEQILRQALDTKITFCGPGGTLDRTEVARAGYEYFELPCPRAPQRFWRFPRFAQRMLQGQWAADAFLRRNDVSAVVGLGGFGSAPMALAAARRSVPLVLLEQNTVLGRANRRLSRKAQALCLAFEDTEHVPAGVNRITHVTGNPIRSTFEARQRARNRVLLVLGGSGGARALNEAMPRAITGLRQLLAGWRVIHQCGANAVAATELAYRLTGVNVTVVPFIANMPSALANSALAVCRAGGSTLAELAMTQTPAVLVPFPHAADDHQRHNARRYERAGAATLVDSVGLSPDGLKARLRDELSRLLADDAARESMSQAMAKLARPNAAQRVAEIVLGFAEAQRSSAPAPRARQRGSRVASFPRLPTLD